MGIIYDQYCHSYLGRSIDSPGGTAWSWGRLYSSGGDCETTITQNNTVGRGSGLFLPSHVYCITIVISICFLELTLRLTDPFYWSILLLTMLCLKVFQSIPRKPSWTKTVLFTHELLLFHSFLVYFLQACECVEKASELAQRPQTWGGGLHFGSKKPQNIESFRGFIEKFDRREALSKGKVTFVGGGGNSVGPLMK